MHHGGVIPCRWPWELLERSGSSSLGGPEKVATVKVTSILPSLHSFVFFSLFPNVSNRLCICARITHARTTNYNGPRPPYSYTGEPKLAVASWYMCTRLQVPADCARNENETQECKPEG